jgi:hypothetical protein
VVVGKVLGVRLLPAAHARLAPRSAGHPSESGRGVNSVGGFSSLPFVRRFIGCEGDEAPWPEDTTAGGLGRAGRTVRRGLLTTAAGRCRPRGSADSPCS